MNPLYFHGETIVRRKNKTNVFDSIKEFFINLKNEFIALSTAQKVAISAVAGVLFVTILGGIIIIVVFSGDANGDDEVASTSISGSSIQDTYDPTEFALQEDSPAILPESEDAGEDYLLNSMFLGDSNTVGFASSGLLPLENVIGVESIGIQSVATGKYVYYANNDSAQTIPYAVAAQQPQMVYMMYGTNNLVGVSPDQFVSNYVKAVNAILEQWEYGEIIVVTIPPIAQVTENASLSQTTIDQFNIALLEMAEENGWKVLNTASLLKDTNGYIKSQYISADGIHLTSAAHEAILNYASTHAYETEDRRPQPLAEQPVRVNPPEEDDDNTSESSSSSDSSSQAYGVASAGEIERLKLAVTTGKNLLAEVVVSATGDGSDLSEGDAAKEWVTTDVYNTLSTAVTTGEGLIALTEPSAAEVITSEATINSAITNLKNNIKTGVDKTPAQIAREELVPSITSAKTTLASAVANDNPANVPAGSKVVPVSIYNALNSAIASAEAYNNNALATEENLVDAKEVLDAAVITFNNSIENGTGPTQAEKDLAEAKAILQVLINDANLVDDNITKAETAPDTVGTIWTTPSAFSALETAISKANTVMTSATSANEVNQEIASLTNSINSFKSSLLTVEEPDDSSISQDDSV